MPRGYVTAEEAEKEERYGCAHWPLWRDYRDGRSKDGRRAVARVRKEIQRCYRSCCREETASRNSIITSLSSSSVISGLAALAASTTSGSASIPHSTNSRTLANILRVALKPLLVEVGASRIAACLCPLSHSSSG